MKFFSTLILVGFLFIGCNSNQQNIKTISTVDLKKLLKTEKIQLLDIRSPGEIKTGFIKTAKFVNFFDDNFTLKASKIINKNKPVYLYCRSGNRSSKAAKLLKEKGYNIVNILGGYNQWKKEN